MGYSSARKLFRLLIQVKALQVSIDWTNITESGERIIYIKVDPDNQIKEIREDDNDAFTTIKILSLPDFSISTNSIVFTPPAPRDGDTVSINVTVKNNGEQSVSDVLSGHMKEI